MASIEKQALKLTETQHGKQDSEKALRGLLAAEETHDYEDDSKLKTGEFIRRRLSRRCSQFVHRSEKDLCNCGKTREEHDPSALDGASEERERSEKTHSAPNKGFDAFGDVIFQEHGQKKAKYVRVNHQSSVNDLLKLMYDHWKMKKPRLLISVTGGAKFYKPKNTQEDLKLTEAFCKGLVQAAESTDAWIITCGTNEGVVKLVGKSLRQRKHRSLKSLIAVGIAPWGCIENRNSLLGDHEEHGATYGFSNVEQSKGRRGKAKRRQVDINTMESPLEPNHTHFIMVDDEKEHQYGGEIVLRAKLEGMISKRHESPDDHAGVPIICIVLEGGSGTIGTARQAIENDTPVLVIEGSGRAADILAHAYHRAEEVKALEKADENPIGAWPRRSINWREIETLIQKKLNLDKTKSPAVVDDVKKFVEKFPLITVFKFDDPNAAENIHKPIIDTLLRVNKDRMAQLRLAVAWNRIDIARDLYPEDSLLRDDDPEEGNETKEETKAGKETNSESVNSQSLEDLMFRAIVENRVEFVKFFLEKGESLGELLNEKPIETFYSQTLPKTSYLKSTEISVTTAIIRASMHQKNETDVNIKKLASWTKDLVDGLFDPIKDKPRTGSARDVISASRKDFDDDDAAMALFFWSVINRLKEMATVFWNNAKEKLALALIGYLMSKNLKQKETDSEQKESLIQQTLFFEGLATDVLSECYSSDQQKTIDHLARQIDQLNNQTVLQIAVRADSKNFLAHSACQELLTKIWYGTLSEGNRPSKSDETSIAKRSNEENDDRPGKVSPDREKRKSYFRSKLKGQFFVSPVVKFRYNCLSYILLLLLYGIILLTDFYPTVGGKEIFLIFWVVTLVLEEGRQIMTSSSESFYGKLVNYFSDTWNILDCVSILTFAIGFALRMVRTSTCEDCFYAARIFLALNFMTFFFRILHMFSIYKQLGPKLIMIGKMMIDLFYFMIILMIFVTAYGVASHVILYPNQTPSISMVGDILSGPWWSLYGGFNNEELSGKDCEPKDLQVMEAKQCASMEKHDLNRTLCPGKDENCPANEWIGPLLLAFYALITNVMMINLLIAMFSNTFNKVEDMADVFWKTQRCHLVLEYESRPILPPPLIIIEHIILVVRKIQDRHRRLRSVCSICPPVTLPKLRFKLKLGPYYQKELFDWLEVNVEEYWMKKETENPESSADKILSDRMDKIIEKMDYLQRNFDEISKILKAK